MAGVEFPRPPVSPAEAGDAASPSAFDRLAGLVLSAIDAVADGDAMDAPVVLAVSGGGDSLALLLAAAHAQRKGRRSRLRFHVVTVDHGLRRASADEARFVAGVCRTHGLPHETFRWRKEKVKGNLSAAARRARYRFLESAARQIGAACVLTAHHEDDQFETHLMARARSAGVVGLGAMRPCRALSPSVLLLRPFLETPGAALKNVVAASGLHAVDDPTNHDADYERVRIRRDLAAQHHSIGGLRAELGRRAAERCRLEQRLATTIAEAERSGRLTLDGGGTLAIDRRLFADLDQATGHAFLARILSAVAGRDEVASGRSLAERLNDLRSGKDASDWTLSGVRVRPRAGGMVEFLREFGRSGPADQPIPAGWSRILFDGRFEIEVSPDLRGGDAVATPFGRFGRGNPVEATLPVLCRQATILAAPPELAPKVAGSVTQLPLFSRLRWRLTRDLPQIRTTLGRRG